MREAWPLNTRDEQRTSDDAVPRRIILGHNGRSIRSWENYAMGAPRQVARSGRAGNFMLHSSQKHQSTYLYNRETKLGINDSTPSVSEPLSVSVLLLSLSVTSYMHRHNTWATSSGSVCETGIVFSNSTVRTRVVKLSSRRNTYGGFSWCAHNVIRSFIICSLVFAKKY
jgi:hypothetical protein